eukprot:1157349-Pelagomonas_calceolata.AAC.12
MDVAGGSAAIDQAQLMWISCADMLSCAVHKHLPNKFVWHPSNDPAHMLHGRFLVQAEAMIPNAGVCLICEDSALAREPRTGQCQPLLGSAMCGQGQWPMSPILSSTRRTHACRANFAAGACAWEWLGGWFDSKSRGNQVVGMCFSEQKGVKSPNFYFKMDNKSRKDCKTDTGHTKKSFDSESIMLIAELSDHESGGFLDGDGRDPHDPGACCLVNRRVRLNTLPLARVLSTAVILQRHLILALCATMDFWRQASIMQAIEQNSWLSGLEVHLSTALQMRCALVCCAVVVQMGYNLVLYVKRVEQKTGCQPTCGLSILTPAMEQNDFGISRSPVDVQQ